MRFFPFHARVAALGVPAVFLIAAFFLITCQEVNSEEANDTPAFRFHPPADSAEPFFHDVLAANFRPHGALAFETDLGKVWFSIFTPGAETFHQSVATSQLLDGSLQEVEYPDLMGESSWGSPVPSSDGNRLYFILTAPIVDGGAEVQNIWYVERADSGWGTPVHLDIPMIGTFIGGQFTFGPEEGTIIITMRPNGGVNTLYTTQLVEGNSYSSATALPSTVNSIAREMDPWYDPQSQILFFSSDRVGTLGAADIYACRYLGEGQWSPAVNLGEQVNSPGYERFSSVSPDGECFFFSRDIMVNNQVAFDYYWISMKIVQEIVGE